MQSTQPDKSTWKSLKDYMEFEGNHCPKCGSWNMEGESAEVQPGCCIQKCYCNECKASWEAYYKLERFIRLKG